MDVATPFVEVADAIVEAGGKDLNLCYQCATCSGSCPWGYVEPLNIRQLIHLAQLGLEGYESEDLWKCTTCATCQVRCPRGVGIIDLVRSIRMMIGETGLIPLTLRSALGSVRGDGNPWNGSRAERNRWAGPLQVPPFDKAKTEYLLYGCCMASYDKRTRKIVEAAVQVLRAAGVTFGVLGTGEDCCAESVRKIGEESLFERVAQSNIELFHAHGVEKILVISPHCYHAFKNDYPGVGGRFDVTHIVEKIASLLLLGKLRLERPVTARVAFHDPCYLGRHNNLYEPPRMILSAIPGLEQVEMIRSRELSLCCGGGGGRMWMETKFGQRFSDLRIPEALAVGANVLATSCPYCVNMLQDSRLNLNQEDAIEVKDLTELVAESLV